MADYPLEFYRRSEQQWRRRTIRPLAPIEDADTPMRRSNQCPQCCIMATVPFVSTYRPGVENTPAPFSRTSHRQRLRGIELSITAPRGADEGNLLFVIAMSLLGLVGISSLTVHGTGSAHPQRGVVAIEP